MPLGLTPAELSDPNTLMSVLPVVAASPAPSLAVQGEASLPASVTAAANLLALPTRASLGRSGMSSLSPFVPPPMTLASTSTLSADAASFSGSVRGSGSDLVSGSAGMSGSGPSDSSGYGSVGSTGYGSGDSSGSGSVGSTGSGSVGSTGYGSGDSSGSGSVGSSGDGSTGSSGDGSGGGTGIDLTPINTTVTAGDGAGDTETLTVSFQPSPDGTYTFDVTLSYSYGTPPTPGAAIADDATNSDGGSGSFHFGIVAGLTSVTFSESENDSDSYNVNDLLAGTGVSGTWTNFGHDSSGSSDTVTVGSDGTGTETDSSYSNSSDKYNLNLSGTTAGGLGFTYADVGNDSSNYNDSGGDGSDGTSSDTPSEDDTATETVTVGESGGNLKASDTTTETAGYHDHVAPVPGSSGASAMTVTSTDDVSATHSYQNSGTINGASFTVSDNRSHTDDESDTDTTGTAGTETQTRDGSGTDTFKLTLSGVDDSSGSGSGSGSSSGSGSGSDSQPTGTSDSLTQSSTSGGSFNDTTTTGPGGAGVATVDDQSTGNSSGSESGTFLGNPFSESDSGSYSDEITFAGVTETGETETQSPPNQVVTGTPPEDGGSQSPIEVDRFVPSTMAYGGAGSGMALLATSITATPAQSPGQVPSSQPATPAQSPGQAPPGQNQSFPDLFGGEPFNPLPRNSQGFIDWGNFFGPQSFQSKPPPQPAPDPLRPLPPGTGTVLADAEDKAKEGLENLEIVKPGDGQPPMLNFEFGRIGSMRGPIRLRAVGGGFSAPGGIGIQFYKQLRGGGSASATTYPDGVSPLPRNSS